MTYVGKEGGLVLPRTFCLLWKNILYLLYVSVSLLVQNFWQSCYECEISGSCSGECEV
jgi:hypothetical protein